MGASTLKGWRLSRRGLPAGAAVPLAAGATAAFLSTLASAWIVRRAESDRSLLPYAVYRTGLAAIVLGRIPALRRSGLHPDPRHA